ncbi:hypothetical protein ABII15_31310 [Streptomyces sp. HUAS MG91]|uniref:UL36 very large tegument protein n=1 Tax=Streptomyces tabacisoli TaxID=3156398 RepID=A0AAU8J0B9_9ACTN
MTETTDAGQLALPCREFATYLRGLVARIDHGAGWLGVFWQRDPEGLRACLDGIEVPPWDVVEALLQDVAAQYGPDRADRETAHARALHRPAVRAHDAAPGGRDALLAHLDAMTREQRHATERRRDLGRLLDSATTYEQAESARRDLAWARDDHDRATARIAELRYRLAELERFPVAPEPHPAGSDALDGEAEPVMEPAMPSRTDATPSRTEADPSDPPRASKPAKTKKRRPRGSARFAGLDVEAPEPPAPDAPLPEAPATATGARFAGARDDAAPAPRTPRTPDPAAREDITATVATLLGLRAAARSGEAHMLLVEAANWPAARLPLLAAELHRAGLGADWATLLWEAASLPPARLVDAADALTAAGRDADGRQVLRQGVGRPPEVIGAAVAGLDADGRRREARILLDAYVRTRTPEEAARSALCDPGRLVPLVLDAARAVTDDRHRDVLHALRLAGHAA